LESGSDGQQAVAADIMAHLTKQAITGEGKFSQAAFNKALREIDPKCWKFLTGYGQNS
jgi:hypothetical protein